MREGGTTESPPTLDEETAFEKTPTQKNARDALCESLQAAQTGGAVSQYSFCQAVICLVNTSIISRLLISLKVSWTAVLVGAVGAWTGPPSIGVRFARLLSAAMSTWAFDMYSTIRVARFFMSFRDISSFSRSLAVSPSLTCCRLFLPFGLPSLVFVGPAASWVLLGLFLEFVADLESPAVVGSSPLLTWACGCDFERCGEAPSLVGMSRSFVY